MNAEPTIGRIVNYVVKLENGKTAVRPAMVTHVAQGGWINVAVFPDVADGHSNLTTKGIVSHSNTPRANTWHWPQRI